MSTTRKQECWIDGDFLILQDQTGITRVPLSAINVIYSNRPYLIIETAGRDYLTLDSLKHLESILSTEFIRINKSVIINLKYIVRFFYLNQKAKIQLINGCKYVISRRKTCYIRNRLLEKDTIKK